jgi:putative DNA primase/helicase
MYTARNGGCSCRKSKACPSPGKHPLTPHGLKDASSDRAVIKPWWRDNPDANIGVVMGPKSGLIAVDIDPRNGGVTTLQDKEKELGKLLDSRSDSSFVSLTDTHHPRPCVRRRLKQQHDPP